MLTQISTQWRFFSPRMPRDQIGYWLIDSSCRIQWEDMNLEYCEGFYENLKEECAGTKTFFFFQINIFLSRADLNFRMFRIQQKSRKVNICFVSISSSFNYNMKMFYSDIYEVCQDQFPKNESSETSTSSS